MRQTIRASTRSAGRPGGKGGRRLHSPAMAGDGRPGIALLSFAHGHQRGWANVFKADDRARLVCAWDSDAARGDQAAGALGLPFVPVLEDVLGRGDVKAVTICS